jgi:hypothetical protein
MILDLIQHPNAICRITENERRVEVCPFVSMQDMRRGLKQIVEKKNVFHETSALKEQQQDNINFALDTTSTGAKKRWIVPVKIFRWNEIC